MFGLGEEIWRQLSTVVKLSRMVELSGLAVLEETSRRLVYADRMETNAG